MTYHHCCQAWMDGYASIRTENGVVEYRVDGVAVEIYAAETEEV